MIVVGLTGGIGSGKTTVAKLLQNLGIPIYIADVEAKRLMNTSKVLKKKLSALFGEDAYVNNELNRPYIASRIFNDKALLAQMNAIVHPKVGIHFQSWLQKQNSPYVIKEAAIIFEQQMESEYDFIITVTADLEDKIARVIKRDGTTEDKIENVIKNQMSDAEKVKRSDFVIVNDRMENTVNQVLKIHQKILQNIDKLEF